jgi:hypothetical protein
MIANPEDNSRRHSENKQMKHNKTTGTPLKGIVSRDFAVLFLFNWIDMKFLIGQDQVYF